MEIGDVVAYLIHSHTADMMMYKKNAVETNRTETQNRT